jgi:hypothetical protein
MQLFQESVNGIMGGTPPEKKEATINYILQLVKAVHDRERSSLGENPDMVLGDFQFRLLYLTERSPDEEV